MFHSILSAAPSRERIRTLPRECARPGRARWVRCGDAFSSRRCASPAALSMLVAALLCGSFASARAPAAEPSAKQDASKLIAILKSNAGEKEKADACRELAHLGGRKAVAPL